MRSVSFVVPVKRSHATIRSAIRALLEQDYPGPTEVIVVGDRNDSSWNALTDELRQRRVTALEVSVSSPGRDSNVKRNVGLEAARGDVLCLIDSDIVLPANWLSTAISLIDQGHQCVSGPMQSVMDGFWSRYVDQNPYASKTPRMEHPYLSRHRSFGVLRKPATTSNVAFTRLVYETVGQFDPSFVHSYEDYEWFYRVAQAQFDVFCTSTLLVEHNHRQGFHALGHEYRRSGRGCAQFVRKHTNSSLARKRFVQLLGVVLLAVIAMLDVVAGLTQTQTPLDLIGLLSILIVSLAILGLGAAWRTRSIEGLVFPIVTLVLGSAFTVGLLGGLVVVRRPHTLARRLGGTLIGGTLVAGFAWYVPRAVSTNERLVTGAVSSGGAVALNFAHTGTISKIAVHPGQKVRKGQVLASEATPDARAGLDTKTAAIAADKARIAQIKAAQAQRLPGASTAVQQLAALNSQLHLHEAQLTADKAKVRARHIIAPAFGTVVAANGQPGQVVTRSGVNDYAAASHSSPSSQRPASPPSPEGPRALHVMSPHTRQLPVIAMRPSRDWTVVALIPATSISRVAGRLVTVSVPAAGVRNVRGKVDQVLKSPVSTPRGTAYQAVIKIIAHVRRVPSNGMAAYIKLGR
jgi:multidrug efflux pump subunit AcrA (membrane-fusion protein)/GT2 family glycosyltransferase